MNTHELIKSAGSRICYLEFEKRNGEVRRMWAIPKVKASLIVGHGRRYDPKEHRITVVRDIHMSEEDCLRAVRWDAILLIVTNGVTYIRGEDGEMSAVDTTRQRIRYTKTTS